MASFFQMNTASTLGSRSLPSNTIANLKGDLKAITTRSGIVLDGPFVPIPPSFINPEDIKRIEKTLTDQDLVEYTIKVPPPIVQKPKPPSQRNFVVNQRDPLHPNIPYPSRMYKQKQQEKDEKMLKALLSNKEKLLELANTPLNKNCSAVILKKLPKKLGDPGKFLIPCGFSEHKCKALVDLGASINLMPLSIWKKLGLPELISTRMTLELANRAICTSATIARDVFVPIGKFTFPTDFVIVDYESDPRVPFILGRPFLRTACTLIDVHEEEIILHDSDERLTLNMRHDTSSYSNQPQKESINMINIYDDSKVKDDVFDPDHVLKPLFPFPIPVEDSDSFLEKSDTSLSYSDNSLPIKPDQGKLTSIVMKDNLAEPRVHVLNVLTTHMLDSNFIPSDNSLPESEIFYFDIEEKNNGSTTIHADTSLSDLECFNFKLDPGNGYNKKEQNPSKTGQNRAQNEKRKKPRWDYDPGKLLCCSGFIDFYMKFYNSLGRVPNRCSSSIGKTRGLLSFSKGIDMAPLLSRDQRYPWLRHQTLGDWLRMVYTGDEGQELFTSHAWRSAIPVRHAEGRKSGARLSRGHFIRCLAAHFGLDSDHGLRGLSVVTRELPLIDFHELGSLNICLGVSNTWAWVARGPERQPDDAAGAPGAAKDAPAVDEGKVRHMDGQLHDSADGCQQSHLPGL
nr:hypothetical protein [Tanacetum cinerariifolium]